MLALSSASEAGTTTTYVCRQADGQRSIQDQPCADGPERTIRTTDTPEPLFFDSLQANQRRWCAFYRGERNRFAEQARNGRTHNERAAGYRQQQRYEARILDQCQGY